jgi:hypothetical protein
MTALSSWCKAPAGKDEAAVLDVDDNNNDNSKTLNRITITRYGW